MGIPATLIADSAAGVLMQKGEVSCVITGADRIAANGDTANKVGTYMLAVLAHENGIPFYIAAPTSTVDLAIAHGDDIAIEERPQHEVTGYGGAPTAPEGTPGVQPGLRRDAAPLHRRHRHRDHGVPAAVHRVAAASGGRGLTLLDRWVPAFAGMTRRTRGNDEGDRGTTRHTGPSTRYTGRSRKTNDD